MRRILLLISLLAIAFAQPRPRSTPEAFWRDVVKAALTGPDARKLFVQNFKDAGLPGGVLGIQSLKGTLLSATPEDAPKEVVLAMSDQTTPEATLRYFDLGPRVPPPEHIPVGAQVEFEGIVREFTSEPFMVIFEVVPEQVRVASQ